jgi:hypothetical protein
MRKVVIRTIGDLEGRSRLVAYCPSCRHRQFLDLEALRQRYGSELSLRSLRARLRCSRCEARRPEMMAKVAVPRALFAEILHRIDHLRRKPPPLPA